MQGKRMMKLNFLTIIDFLAIIIGIVGGTLGICICELWGIF